MIGCGTANRAREAEHGGDLLVLYHLSTFGYVMRPDKCSERDHYSALSFWSHRSAPGIASRPNNPSLEEVDKNSIS